MTEVDERFAALEARVRLLEDRAEIFQLMAAYGPAVDRLSGDALAALWTEDGRYDIDDQSLAGAQQIGELIRLDTHRQYVAAGAAHVISLPQLRITGDRAVAIGYSCVYVCTGPRHEVLRSSSNRWEFRRTPQGWRVQRRINRRLAGSEAARGLLAPAAPTDRP